MDVEEFKQKYEQLKDNPMYKNFCSILDTKSQMLERISKENQELKKEIETYNKGCSELRKIIEQKDEKIEELKKQLGYLHGGEYLNQLRFERNMLQDVVNKMEVSKEDKRFIDMTHRNTELLEENRELNRKLEAAKELVEEQVKKEIDLKEINKDISKGLQKVSFKRNKWKKRYYTERRKNQELKGQLEVGKEQYNDLVEEKEELQEQLSNSNQIKTKQKEFIEWLENLIGQNETVIEVSKYGLPKECSKLLIDFYKSILSKYKEIVGGNNDQ